MARVVWCGGGPKNMVECKQQTAHKKYIKQQHADMEWTKIHFTFILHSWKK